MEILGWILFLGITGFFVGKWIKHKSLYPFMPFRYDFRKRRDSFRLAMKLMDFTHAKTIVETGTSREGLRGAKSNGAATIVFGKWARENGAFVHSVDISQESVNNAQAEVDRQGLSNVVKIHTSDSVQFLSNFDQQVNLLYLDSYDYSDDPEVQRKSQEHHLKEFKAIEDRLYGHTIVLIDDCDLPNGGKGKMAIEYMLQNDWKIAMQAYQVLLVRNDFPLDKVK
ncbi:class I SAM-dependent methyltransferase [Allomuricauda sp. d1]|uniref:class I SAM-dependent methyltransferase n=1 Tax=Allomuricauda sp. d1 TaxID=3136725 RepID=UPI0031CF4BF9